MQLNNIKELNVVLREGKAHMQRIIKSLPKGVQSPLVIPDALNEKIKFAVKVTEASSIELKKLNILANLHNMLQTAGEEHFNSGKKVDPVETADLLSSIQDDGQTWIKDAEKIMQTQRNSWFEGKGLIARILRALFSPQPKSQSYVKDIGLFAMNAPRLSKLKEELNEEVNSEDEDEIVFSA